MKRSGLFLLCSAILWLLPQTSNAGRAGDEIWSFTTSGVVNGAAAIAADGTIYAGTAGSKVYALNPDGTQKWSVGVGASIAGTPAIAADGTVYVASNARLYALNADGTTKWIVDVASGIYPSSPAIATDGTIYVGSTAALIALDAGGAQSWSFAPGGSFFSPVVGTDGTLYAVNYLAVSGYSLYAVNPDGTQKWSYAGVGYAGAVPHAAADGTIYVGSDDALYAINADGTLKWSYAPIDVFYLAATGLDGTVYVGSGSTLYAVNPDGTQKWSFPRASSPGRCPVIDTDGTVYMGSIYGLFAFDPDGTEKWSLLSTALNGVTSVSPTMGADGPIYVGWGNTLRAIESKDGLDVADANRFFFQFTGNDPIEFSIVVDNATSQDLTIDSATFGAGDFSLATTLPVTVPSGGSTSLDAVLSSTDAGFHQSAFQFTYLDNVTARVSSEQIGVGLFLDDDSELAYAAHRAIIAFTACKSEDPESINTKNNQGVLLRLVQEPLLAEPVLDEALTLAEEAQYGIKGINMNLGVVKSDQDLSTDATNYYSLADSESYASDLSILNAQVKYNMAWEAYRNNDYSSAKSHLDDILVNSSTYPTNGFLKAKVFVLRSALYYQAGEIANAVADLESAMSNDPDGPIGRLAQQNMDALPRIYVSPTDYDFGDIYLGESASALISVVNRGDAAIDTGAVAILEVDHDSYTISQDNCSHQTLAAQATTSFTVSFSPSEAGDADNITVEIPTSDTDTPTLTVSLTGRGVAYPDPGGGNPPSRGSGEDGGGGGCFIAALSSH
jgi:outer membrane protein assembly factor BamB/tetratricopeptide (TPR) repeat protein